MSILGRIRAGITAARAYEAALSIPSRRPVTGGHYSPDSATEIAHPRLRDFGRYLDENHDLVVGILDELVKGVVGQGIVTIPKPRRANGVIDERFADVLTDRWEAWTRTCDTTGELHWSEAQRLICRAWMRDGEQFIHHVTDYPITPGQTPYRIELLESDMVPHDLRAEDTGWRQGIRLDEWRRPLEYAVYREHPGETQHTVAASLFPSFDNLKRVDAAMITHLKSVKRWPQTRGVTVLHPVIGRLYDIKDLEESERIKNRILASWTAAINRSPDIPGFEQHDTNTGARYLQMAGGTVIDSLLPGESITGVGPEYPNPELNDYIGDQIRRVASGTGTRYSSISKRYEGNYASQRQELVESEGHIQMREDAYVQKVNRTVYERWMLSELLSGQTSLPPGMTFEGAANAEYRGPITPWIDPLKEVQADALAVREKFVTRSQIQIKRGASPETIGDEPEPEPAPAPTAVTPIRDADEDDAEEDAA